MSSTAVPPTGLPGRGDFIRAPAHVNLSALGVSSAVTITIPSGCNMVELRPDLVSVFVKWGSTAVSTGAASDGTASEVITPQSGGVRRAISPGTTAISVMSTAACSLSQAWWSV